MWPFPKRNAAAATPARVEPTFAPRASAAPTYPLSDPDAWEKLFGPHSHKITSGKARENGAFWACIDLIAGQIAALPVHSRPLDAGLSDVETSGARARLFADPNPGYSRVTFWRQYVASMLTDGNGVAWIERRGAVPVALHVIPWGRAGVYFYTAPGGRRRKKYHLVLDDGTHVEADQDDVLHTPGSPFWNILYSVSPVTAYALVTGIAIDADRFAEAYFRNSATPEGFIALTGSMTSAQADEYRKDLKRRFSGENRFDGPAMLTGGATWQSMRINAADAQILESRQFNKVEIATIFHVPPHLINVFDKVQAFGKGLQELNQGFLDYTLGPHIDAIEAELRRKLYGPTERYGAFFDRDAFERGDLKTQNEADQMAVGGAQGPGWTSINEVRMKRRLAPYPEPEFDRPLQWGAAAPQKPASGKSDPNAPGPAGPDKPAQDPAPEPQKA